MGDADRGELALDVIGPSDVLGRRRLGVVGLAEREVSQREPHLVVSTDAADRITAFVETMRLEEAAVDVTEGSLAEVIDNDGLKSREAHVGQDSSASFDMTRNRESIPEALPEIMLQEILRLSDARVVDSVEQ